VTVEVSGAADAIKSLRQVGRELSGAPMEQAMRECTLLVLRDARKNVTVNTGQLRASIMADVRAGDNVVTGVVGSNVVHAPCIELGTRPHWPPIEPILRWVHLKLRPGRKQEKAVAFLVARKIAREGTAPRPYLQPAFDANQDAIEDKIGKVVSEIVARGNE